MIKPTQVPEAIWTKYWGVQIAPGTRVQKKLKILNFLVIKPTQVPEAIGTKYWGVQIAPGTRVKNI